MATDSLNQPKEEPNNQSKEKPEIRRKTDKTEEEGTGEGNKEKVEDGLGARGKAAVTITFLVWGSLFLSGILVDSEPYRRVVSPSGFEKTQPDAPRLPKALQFKGPTWQAWCLTLLIYTPTNLLLLCLASGLLGALGRQASLHASDHSDYNPPDLINPNYSALLRAFLLYLGLVSGILIITDDPITAPSPSQYVRIAGIISLSSFLVNYRSEFFNNILRRLSDRLKHEENGSSQDKNREAQIQEDTTE